MGLPSTSSPVDIGFRARAREHVLKKFPNFSKKQADKVIGFEAFLDRVFQPVDEQGHTDPQWALTGSLSLVCRGRSNRFSADIDLAPRGSEQVPDTRQFSFEELVSALETKLSIPSNNGFSFALNVEGANISEHVLGEGDNAVLTTTGYRIPVDVFHEGIKFTSIVADLSSHSFEGEITTIGSLGTIDGGVATYSACRIEDVIAGKVRSVMSGEASNTANAKDVWDLAMVARSQCFSAEIFRDAIFALGENQLAAGKALPVNQDRTKLISKWNDFLARHALKDLDVPTVFGEGSTGAQLQQKSTITMTPQIAIENVRMLIDPILDGTASGYYNPNTGLWGYAEPIPEIGGGQIDPSFIVDPPIFARTHQITQGLE